MINFSSVSLNLTAANCQLSLSLSYKIRSGQYTLIIPHRVIKLTTKAHKNFFFFFFKHHHVVVTWTDIPISNFANIIEAIQNGPSSWYNLLGYQDPKITYLQACTLTRRCVQEDRPLKIFCDGIEASNSN